MSAARRPPRPRSPGSRRRRTGDASGSRPRMSAEAWTRSAPGNASGVRDRVDDGDPPAGGRAERRERPGDRGRAGDPQERGGQMRFHVDLQRAPGMAGHDQLDDAVARGGPRPDRPSTAGAGAAGRRRCARSASRTTTGWAQLPPTQPSIVPSGWTMPARAGPRRGRPRTATTVATANGRPAASSSAARAKIERAVIGA